MSDVLIELARIAEFEPIALPAGKWSAEIDYLAHEGYIFIRNGRWLPSQTGIDLLAEYNWVG